MYVKNRKKYRSFGILLVFIGIFPLCGPTLNARSEHSETISVLQSLYQDEMQALHNYQAFAKKAVSEKYPRIIERIKPEKHAQAIRFITFAWESEKQHRELLKQMQSGTGIFFGLLTKRIEGSPSQYFVCQNCGSTLSKIPKVTCPICGEPPAKYEEIIWDFDDDVADEKHPHK